MDKLRPNGTLNLITLLPCPFPVGGRGDAAFVGFGAAAFSGSHFSMRAQKNAAYGRIKVLPEVAGINLAAG